MSRLAQRETGPVNWVPRDTELSLLVSTDSEPWPVAQPVGVPVRVHPLNLTAVPLVTKPVAVRVHGFKLAVIEVFVAGSNEKT
jgi:hypothetical protein